MTALDDQSNHERSGGLSGGLSGWRARVEHDRESIAERHRAAAERAQAQKVKARVEESDESSSESPLIGWRSFASEDDPSQDQVEWRAFKLPDEERERVESERRAKMEERAQKRAERAEAAKRDWASRSARRRARGGYSSDQERDDEQSAQRRRRQRRAKRGRGSTGSRGSRGSRGNRGSTGNRAQEPQEEYQETSLRRDRASDHERRSERDRGGVHRRAQREVFPQDEPPYELHESAQRGEEREDGRYGKRQGKKREKKKRVKPPIDGAWIKRSGLHYLGRFSASERHFRSVMMQKIKRAESRASEDPSDHEAWIDAAVEEARLMGGLNDAQLAIGLARSMNRRGLARRAARQKLAQKKLGNEDIERALSEIYDPREGEVDPTLHAAARAAKKARIGPWGPDDVDYPARQKQLAKLARRGFSYQVAQRVLRADLEEAEQWLHANL